MKITLFISIFITLFSFSPKLSQLRTDYPKANGDEVIIEKLFEQLSPITKENEEALVAYKGAVLTLKAKYAKGVKNKKGYFKQGVQLLEYAVAEKPRNIEIRCLRLSVQENAPKVTGYKKNIPEDKQFLIKNYKTITNKEIKTFVRSYIQQSDVFNTMEKQLF